MSALAPLKLSSQFESLKPLTDRISTRDGVFNLVPSLNEPHLTVFGHWVLPERLEHSFNGLQLLAVRTDLTCVLCTLAVKTPFPFGMKKPDVKTPLSLE